MTNSNGCWIAYAALNPNKIFHVPPCSYWTRFARQQSSAYIEIMDCAERTAIAPSQVTIS
jgi:hypothetical protein